MNNTGRLVISIAIPLAIGTIGGLFTKPEINNWYQALEKPSWTPPSWVFAPVWTVLYILMGIALYILWKKPAFRLIKRVAIGLFILQLLLNLAWSWLFFQQHNPELAFIDIILLWLSILGCIFTFAKVYKSASLLMVPYIAWVSFAAILNYAIWQLN